MTKGLFVTATGTDIGKTFISALLVKKMRAFGINCGYYKPVLSGAKLNDGKLIPGDCEYVLQTAGIDANPLDCASYIFKTPVSPHLAAEIEGTEIKKEKIKADFEKKKLEFDYIVVEGAGGICCPINLKHTTVLLPEIIKMLELEAVIVTNAELGSINNAILTSEYIKNCGIKSKGFIINHYNENDFMQKDNKTQIANLTGEKIISTVKTGAEDLDITKERLLDLFVEI